MASTYVNDLRLNEMATGDASGSWGTVTNTNLELIGEAFSYGTETIGDADSTLTIADGASDPVRSFFLKITSSVDLTTTRIVTLAPNTVSKVWMIENATTGSQVITIKQGSGATINVPNGQVKMISTDGAGSGGAVLDLLVDVDLTGTTTLVNLDVSGTLGVTGVLTATSLDISGDIDVDGTTNLDVVDIDGATQIDATVTVGVDDTGYDVKFFGATTGKSLLWDESADSLIVTGTTTLVGTTNLDAVDIDGATQIDATVTVGVDDTGYDVKFFGATAGKYMLWDESADTLEVSGTVVADGLTVDNGSSQPIATLVTTGVGGGTQPTLIFHRNTDSLNDTAIVGAISWQAGTASNEVAGIVVDHVGTSENAARMEFYTAESGNYRQRMRIAENGDISFYEDTGTTAKFFWDASAERLAVGGTTTNATLHVHGNSVISNGNYFSIQSSSGLSPELDEASNGWAFTTNGSERLRIDSSGNVGIGTSSPTSGGGLTLSSSTTAQGFINFKNTVDGDSGFIGNAKALVTGGTTNQLGVRGQSNGIVFSVGSTEAARIDSSGNVGIGTSSPSQKLDVVGSIEVSDGIYLGGTGAANKLDDYEEGTWTPTLGGNTTYSIQSGTYVKVGRLVFVQGLLSVGTLGTGSATTVSGLPFPANNVNSSNQGGSITYFASLAVNVITPTTYVPDNTSSFSVKSNTSAGTGISSDLAIFGNSTRIDFSITYETDS
jgi:hypothetical protein